VLIQNDLFWEILAKAGFGNLTGVIEKSHFAMKTAKPKPDRTPLKIKPLSLVEFHPIRPRLVTRKLEIVE